MNAKATMGIFLFLTAAIVGRAQSSGTNDQFVVTPTLRQPAVSQINGKVDYSGGEMNSAEGHNFSASLSLPVSHSFGFQADGFYSRIGDLNFGGGAGHIFWRDPAIGLVGLTGGYLHRDGFDAINTYQGGVETEYYWWRFTFGAFAGAGGIDYQYSAPFIDTQPVRFVGRVSADYYALDNLRVGGSFMTAFKDYCGKAEAEYQLPIRGLALTVESAWGNNNYHHWLLGVRWYFGGNKSLRDRQRQDDPPSLMPQTLHSLGVYGAEFNHKMNDYVAAHPSQAGGGNSNGGGYGLQITTVDGLSGAPILFSPPPQ